MTLKQTLIATSAIVFAAGVTPAFAQQQEKDLAPGTTESGPANGSAGSQADVDKSAEESGMAAPSASEDQPMNDSASMDENGAKGAKGSEGGDLDSNANQDQPNANPETDSDQRVK